MGGIGVIVIVNVRCEISLSLSRCIQGNLSTCASRLRSHNASRRTIRPDWVLTTRNQLTARVVAPSGGLWSRGEPMESLKVIYYVPSNLRKSNQLSLISTAETVAI